MRAKVKVALSATNVPVFWQGWKGEGSPPAQYFSLNVMNYPGDHSEDKQDERVHYIYLELFSETDFLSLIPTIRTGMAGQGFSPVEERDAPESDGYHLSMTWMYREEI